MKYTQKTLWWLPGVAVLLLGVTAAEPTSAQSHAHRGYCVEGQCYPNPMYFGYYPTQWRRWPSAQPQSPTPADDQVAPPRQFPAGDVPDPLDEAAPNPSRRDRDGRLFRPRRPDELPGGTSRDPSSGGGFWSPDPRTDIRMPGSTTRQLAELRQQVYPQYEARQASYFVTKPQSQSAARSREDAVRPKASDAPNPLRLASPMPVVSPRPNKTVRPTDDGYLPLPSPTADRRSAFNAGNPLRLDAEQHDSRDRIAQPTIER
jgi:hypothetical protein